MLFKPFKINKLSAFHSKHVRIKVNFTLVIFMLELEAESYHSSATWSFYFVRLTKS